MHSPAGPTHILRRSPTVRTRLIALLALVSGIARADEWAQWRGTDGSGHSPLAHDLLHDVELLAIEHPQPIHSLNSYASPSPVFADGRIYVGNRDGDTFVLRPGKTFELLATNHLDGRIMATPVPLGRAIYLRTDAAIYRIEKP